MREQRKKISRTQSKPSSRAGNARLKTLPIQLYVGCAEKRRTNTNTARKRAEFKENPPNYSVTPTLKPFPVPQ